MAILDAIIGMIGGAGQGIASNAEQDLIQKRKHNLESLKQSNLLSLEKIRNQDNIDLEGIRNKHQVDLHKMDNKARLQVARLKRSISSGKVPDVYIKKAAANKNKVDVYKKGYNELEKEFRDNGEIEINGEVVKNMPTFDQYVYNRTGNKNALKETDPVYLMTKDSMSQYKDKIDALLNSDKVKDLQEEQRKELEQKRESLDIALSGRVPVKKDPNNIIDWAYVANNYGTDPFGRPYGSLQEMPEKKQNAFTSYVEDRFNSYLNKLDKNKTDKAQAEKVLISYKGKIPDSVMVELESKLDDMYAVPFENRRDYVDEMANALPATRDHAKRKNTTKAEVEPDTNTLSITQDQWDYVDEMANALGVSTESKSTESTPVSDKIQNLKSISDYGTVFPFMLQRSNTDLSLPEPKAKSKEDKLSNTVSRKPEYTYESFTYTPPKNKKNLLKDNKFIDTVKLVSDTYNVDPDIILSMIEQESAGNPNAKSSVGAYGLLQLMPITAKDVNVEDVYKSNILANLVGGVKYFKKMLDRFGDLDMALAAYNAGPTAVRKAGGVPNYKETKNYVKSVKKKIDRYKSKGV